MKKAVFITVRSDSSRLPNKALKTILGKPIIELIILRAKLVKNADCVIVCTTERPIDDEIVKIAERNGVNYFRGNLEDKLDRWNRAAQKFEIDYFATFDGDDPLCDPELIDLALATVDKIEYDFMKAPDGLIIGSFTYCIKATALKKVCEIKDSTDTEMMWTYFEDTGIFNVGVLPVKEKIYFNNEIRATLDYEDDFLFFKKIFEHFKCDENNVPLKDIAAYLNENPEIVKINAFRRLEWENNQKMKTKLVLKKTKN